MYNLINEYYSPSVMRKKKKGSAQKKKKKNFDSLYGHLTWYFQSHLSSVGL